MAWFVLRQLLFFFFFNGSHSFPCCRYARFGDTVENTERKKKPLECRNKILGQQIEAYWVLDTRSSKSPTPKPGFRAFESVPVSRLKISATHWEKKTGLPFPGLAVTFWRRCVEFTLQLFIEIICILRGRATVWKAAGLLLARRWSGRDQRTSAARQINSTF